MPPSGGADPTRSGGALDPGPPGAGVRQRAAQPVQAVVLVVPVALK